MTVSLRVELSWWRKERDEVKGENEKRKSRRGAGGRAQQARRTQDEQLGTVEDNLLSRWKHNHTRTSRFSLFFLTLSSKN